VTIEPHERLPAFDFDVPADISSAAFFMVAAAIVSSGPLTCTRLSINQTRTGVLDILEECGLSVAIENLSDELGEPVGDVTITAPNGLSKFSISGALVPRLIDEIPVLAVLATQCEGETTIRDAKELRIKESDRLLVTAEGLRRMGADVEMLDDGLTIVGPTQLHAAAIDAAADHRIAMAFAVAGLIAEGETVIEGAEAIETSFPGFEKELNRLAGR
jgi:3-phosphoshikimate 1-carboxyvinyltransferase